MEMSKDLQVTLHQEHNQEQTSPERESLSKYVPEQFPNVKLMFSFMALQCLHLSWARDFWLKNWMVSETEMLSFQLSVRRQKAEETGDLWEDLQNYSQDRKRNCTSGFSG